MSPQEVVDRFHSEFLESWRRLGISFDLFTTTGTENHAEVVQKLFLTLLEKGYIYKDTMLLPYSAEMDRFLPDRYVEGICPFCDDPGARGDQCDACGRTLNPTDLIEPRSAIGGSILEFRESEHFFLKLTAFQEPLLEVGEAAEPLAAQRVELHPAVLGRRIEGPGNHPRYTVGHSDSA